MEVILIMKKIRTYHLKIFNKSVNVNLYKIISKPICMITSNINYYNLTVDDYRLFLNKHIKHFKEVINANSNFCISLYKYIISINITNYRTQQKFDTIILD